VPEEPTTTDEAAATPPAPAPRWGIGHAVLGYVAAYLVAGLAVSIYASVAGLDAVDRTLGLAIASLIGLWIGMLGAVLVAVRRQRTEGHDPDANLRTEFGLAFRWSDLPLGAAAGIASQLILVPVLYLPFKWHDPTLSKRLEEPAKELTDLAHGAGFVVLAILITLGAPLVEELFFRGLLQRSLLRRLGPTLAITLSSAAFGLVHYQPLQLLGLTAFGVVLGVLAWRTGRLGAGIVAHVCFNLVTVIALGFKS
jgi:membrane protease YdiL (CAAX protease family)